MRYQRPWILVALVASLIPLGACEYAELQAVLEDGTLEILPRETTLTAIGDTVHLAATFLVDGERIQPDIGDAVQWSTSDSGIAEVRSDGTVEARGNGRSIIRGTLRGQKDSVTVIVEQVAERVAVRADSSTLTAVGSTTQLRAEVFDKNGFPIADATASWRSSDPAIAEVDEEGRVVAHAEGEVDIVAVVEGAAPDTVRISIEPEPAPAPEPEPDPAPDRITLSPDSLTLSVGESRQVRARAVDANGAPTANPDLAWISSNPEIASVDSMGIVTARAAGIALITFTAVCCSPDTATVVVMQTPASVDVTPGSTTITALGDTVQLSARVLDESGDAVPGVEVTWTSTDPSVAEVNASGVVVARGEGTSSVIASADGVTPDTVTIHVNPAPAEVTVSPTTSRMRVGDTRQLSAEVSDANGSPIADPELTWTSLNPEVASVSPIGVVTARAVGTALITVSAVCCSEADTAEVVVDPDNRQTASNEPPGFVVISERAFNAKNEDGWSDSNGRTATFSIVSDPSAPRSPTNVGRVEYPAGYTGHGSSSQVVNLRRSGWEASDVYVSFWFKLSDNWQGHGSGVNKIFYLTDSSSGGEGDPLVFAAHGSGSGRLHFDVRLQNPDTEIRNYEWDDRDNEANPTFEEVELVRGKWHHIEVLIRSNNPGRANGEVHAWVDGVNVLRFTGQELLSPRSDGTLDNLRWHPIWGGQHTMNVDRTMYQYIDHLYLSAGS